jgi:GTP pyrophosphokinase
MVAILQTAIRDTSGKIDRQAWFNRLSIRYPKEKLNLIAEWFGKASDFGVEVANILLELQADLEAVLAALLIDYTPKNTEKLPAGIQVILKNLADLRMVEKKLLFQREHSKLESIRGMMLAMIKDVRVVLVKLAERTLAARQSKLLSPAEQQSLAHGLMELYAPLANRLGIGALKWELEDRAFALLNPKAYLQVTESLKLRRIEREAFVQAFIEELSQSLEDAGVAVEVSGRVKHIHGIWQKMQKKALDFNELYDVRAVRVLVRDVSACYTAMAVLHAKWTPLVSEYTDYIVQPKENGYRSLHTILEGKDGLPIEVQIRTYGMHTQAESGVAAHWRYKEGSALEAAGERVAWLRALLDWQAEVSEQVEVPQQNEPIYVFTKDNEVLVLKPEATPIDFAFLVHTDVGLRTKGARINGSIVPLTTRLKTGDQVEILLHKIPRPSFDWLNASAGFLGMPHSKRKLRAYFRSLTEEPGKTRAEEEVTVPVAVLPPKRAKVAREGMLGISVSGVRQLPFDCAKCCHPERGVPIIASMTRARGLVIHRKSCPYIAIFKQKRPDRLYEVEWD